MLTDFEIGTLACCVLCDGQSTENMLSNREECPPIVHVAMLYFSQLCDGESAKQMLSNRAECPPILKFVFVMVLCLHDCDGHEVDKKGFGTGVNARPGWEGGSCGRKLAWLLCS